jgi:hypothetical protein
LPPRRRRRWWLGWRRSLLLGKKACGFLPHICCTLLSNTIPGFSTGNKAHKIYFRVWILSGIRMCFVGQNKLGMDG